MKKRCVPSWEKIFKALGWVPTNPGATSVVYEPEPYPHEIEIEGEPWEILSGDVRLNMEPGDAVTFEGTLCIRKHIEGYVNPKIAKRRAKKGGKA